MPERDSYAPGTPCWVDLMTRDAAAAKEFYGAIFGWTADDVFNEQGQPAGEGEPALYTMWSKNGRYVGGLGEMGEEQLASGMPPAWSTYIATADIDATASRVAELGGTVVVPPMDVFDNGRMCLTQDPSGAFVSFWQPGTHPGAGLVHEPGSLTWSELQTRDPAKARAFYEQLLGWKAETHPGPMPYTEFSLDGTTIAGMMQMPEMVPKEVPSYWLTYFAVADCEASVAQIQGLGGTVLAPLMELPVGRFAVLSDPQEAVFGILQQGERTG